MVDASLDPVRPSSIDGLIQDWDFVASRMKTGLQLRTWRRAVMGLRRAPQRIELKAVQRHPVWMMYFVFTPAGRLNAGHEFTLARLRESGLPLLVVCAAPSVREVPPQLRDAADALYWKALSGYDFSAYALGLHAIAAGSPGATVCVMNDSVFGPFSDLRPIIAASRWDLTGFTASSLHANHIQSYAFIMKGVEPRRLALLRHVLPTRFAFNHGFDVVFHQELGFARAAAQHMSVGARWFSPDSRRVADPTLNRPFELVEAGFPFVKRSLIGKHAQFQEAQAVRALLRRLGHPVEPAQ